MTASDPTTVHDDGAERAVLGILLQGPEAASEVRRLISLEDLYQPRHQLIYAAATRLDDAREPVEPTSVLSELRKSGDLKDAAETAGYLADLFTSAPPPTSIGHYAALVREAATRRGLAVVGARMQQMAGADAASNPITIVEQMRSKLDELAIERIGTDVPVSDDIIAATLDEIDAIASGKMVAGIPTGFKDLDYALNGLRGGQVIIVAARPGVGKSTLALDIARHVAFKQRKAVLMFSLEMGRNEVMMRALSGEAFVELHALKTGQLDEHKWQQLSEAARRMYGAHLGIDDNASVTLTDIRAKARAFQRVHGLDLVIIDYLQLMNGDRRSENRQQEVSDISRGVKLLAKEFNIPVIALSQLNRGSEQRQDKRPAISDLRESGSLEQDADVVLLLHRDEVYDPDSPRAGEADVIIAKQRSGPMGTVILSWLGKFSRFDNRTIPG